MLASFYRAGIKQGPALLRLLSTVLVLPVSANRQDKEIRFTVRWLDPKSRERRGVFGNYKMTSLANYTFVPTKMVIHTF